MLKVVGASWLQTRISTYILIAVALLGIGTIILGEFGHVEQDGTYSATVSWNHKGGYRIDFWGQGNDLTAVPLNAARAYYRTGIFESGWSMIEIETSPKYPDFVQAYAAGLLEGSLTWQLIHHHWYNTVHSVCKNREVECRKLMRYLRENTAIIRERALLLEPTDPFWHMVRLFYTQIDGLEAGWRFAVRRSRQSVELAYEDFLWLAMASDIAGLEKAFNISESDIGSNGMILLKKLLNANSEPLIGIGHNTAASYTKMLRLLKKYTFGYHVLSTSNAAPRVPGRSIIMSSYPGALSSQDEFYVMQGEHRELIVTGTPLAVSNRSLWKNALLTENEVMSTVRLMAANRLATDGRSWSRMVAYQNNGVSASQWVTFEPRTANIWLVEQLLSITHAVDYTQEFKEAGFLSCTGVSHFQEIRNILTSMKVESLVKEDLISNIQENVTTFEQFGRLMRGGSQEENNVDENFNDLPQELAYRGDLDETSLPNGIIDSKILTIDADGVKTFEATCGPVRTNSIEPFKWSESFPNISHIGQPDAFAFNSISPLWVWI